MTEHTAHGLDCQHSTLQARVPDDADTGVPATENTTDLRRARQRARSVVRGIADAVISYLEDTAGIESRLDDPSRARRVNEAITQIASEHLRERLVAWLDDRHRTTIGRAARAAFDQMQQTLPDGADPSFRDEPRFSGRDREMLRTIRQVDAGMLYDTELAERLGLTEPLAQELGDDVTRQLRQGVDQGETVSGGLRDRIDAVIWDSDSPARQRKVSGQTKRSKAELIAHDSVQDAYNTAARKRYMRNGFRFAVYDATIDTKTTDLCRRMNEYVIDMRDDPLLIPPLHPYCRSGIRPILDVGDRDILRPDDVADGYLKTINQTKSYRPQVVDSGQFNPTPLSHQYDHV